MFGFQIFVYTVASSARPSSSTRFPSSTSARPSPSTRFPSSQFVNKVSFFYICKTQSVKVSFFPVRQQGFLLLHLQDPVRQQGFLLLLLLLKFPIDIWIPNICIHSHYICKTQSYLYTQSLHLQHPFLFVYTVATSSSSSSSSSSFEISYRYLDSKYLYT
jgi:hypothetical protein